MATFTPQKGYSLPVVGADLNIWGNELNNGFTLLDNNMGGTSTIAITGGTVTATSAQASALIQNLTGVLTSNAIYALPQLGGFYAIENNTTGAFSVTVVTSASAGGVVVPQGTVLWVYSDGTNIRRGAPAGWQEIGTTTVTGSTGAALLLPIAFRRFRLTFVAGTVSTPATINLSVSINNNSSFITTATYTSSLLSVSAPTTVAGSTTPNTTSIQITPVMAGPLDGWDAYYEISPGFGTDGFFIHGRWAGILNVSGAGMSFISGFIGAMALVNGISFSPSAGTLSLTAILEGLP